MARKCAICGKGVAGGMQISHSHIRTKKTWSPNLQRVKILVNENVPKRTLVCTRCLRSGKVQRAI
jgi:large subunit ribosomal protein L28